jgi:uncharacterized membrane protein YdjX (TVP38/TMEM64 family)
MTDTKYDALRARYRARRARRRGKVVVGCVILLAGYALLGVSPETASEWVLIRVFAGFALLFVGFAVAILPLLSRLIGGESSGDDDER